MSKPTYEELEAKVKQLEADNEKAMSVLKEANDAVLLAKSKFEALAAENAKLADCANFYRLGFNPVKGAFGIEYRPTEQLLDDCGNTAIEAIKTPATDAFLAEVRAQGVEMFANAQNKIADDEAVKGNVDLSPRYRGMSLAADTFAAQLRKGVQS
ncbi:hypothetical protein [Citrobacter koseri]|uniref:hypothetical protein n=1 Tax=Citrobacter koseri TaxID=545 RepID=UPI000DF0E871|nr:hypothetical protein [Citrobacter koseri]STB29513.1 Uncharacterised protein [Citrobacter koseri]